MRKLNLLALPNVKVARWYISLEYYWVLVSILVMPTVLAEMQAYNSPGARNAMLASGLHKIDSGSLIVKWIVIKLSGFTLLFLFLSLVRVLLRARGVKSLKAWQLVAVALVGGIINGFLQHFLVQELDVFETGTHFARVVAPVTLAAFLLFGLSIISSTVRKYRIEAEKAEKDLESLDSMHNLQQEILGGYQDLSAAVSAKIHSRSNEAMHRLTELNIQHDLLDPTIADDIRLISDSTIRELSHEIAATYQKTNKSAAELGLGQRSINFYRVFRDSVNFAPLHPFGFSFAFILLLTGAMIRHATWNQGLFMGLGCFGIIYIVQLFGVYLYRLFGWQNIYTVSAITLFSGSLPLILLQINLFNFRALVPDWNNYPPSRGVFMGGIIAVTFVGYVQQAGLLVSDDILKSRRQKLINTQLEIKPYNKEIVQISRNWARHLHGRVQSQILAATFSLEKAQENADLDGVRKAFNEIVRVLLDADKIAKFEATTLKQEITKRTEQWSGMIEIAMRISPELAPRVGMEIHVVADIVEEMITNASRHGAATSIRIELERRTPTQLSIKAIDNGHQFDVKTKGFGSRFFDEVSQGRWDISRNQAFGETTVSVLFELENIYIFEHHPLAP